MKTNSPLGEAINPYSRSFHHEVKHADPNKLQHIHILCEYLLKASSNENHAFKRINGSNHAVRQIGSSKIKTREQGLGRREVRGLLGIRVHVECPFLPSVLYFVFPFFFVCFVFPFFFFCSALIGGSQKE